MGIVDDVVLYLLSSVPTELVEDILQGVHG